MKIRVALAGLLAAALALGFSAPASAHVFKTDNGVTVELHIPPDDTPHSGEHTTLQFEFSNAANNFSLVDYRPAVSVMDGTHDTTAVPIKTTGADTGTADVFFPKAGTYSLAVTGNPKAGAPDFSVHYEVKVTASPQAVAKKSSSAAPLITIAAAAGCIVLLTGLRLWFARRSRQN